MDQEFMNVSEVTMLDQNVVAYCDLYTTEAVLAGIVFVHDQWYIAHEELLVYMKLKTVDIHVHRHSLLSSYSITTDWLPGGDPPLTSASGKSPANWCSTTYQIKSKASLMPLHAMKTIQRSVFICLVVYVNVLYCEIAKWWISFQNIKRK